MLATYEHFDLLMRSRVYVPHLWHKFTFSFMPTSPAFNIKFFQFHIKDCSASFNSQV